MHGDSWDVLDFVHCSQFHPKLLHSVFCQHFYYKYYHALFSCLLVLCHANSLCFPLMLDERVSSDLKKNLMQARLDKKLTQAQLAQMINEKPQVIQEYESGKAIPNNQIIGKLERALGAKLRNKK